MTVAPIYFDCHATTPCDPRVVEAMAPTFSEDFGNAASRQHVFGWRAESLVEAARRQVARLIECDPREVIFTSGATEADNLAVRGVAMAPTTKGRHIVTCVTEHKAVLDPCQQLESRGFRVTYLPVRGDGRVRVEDVERAVTPETALVSIMYANNEIGTVHPVPEIGRLLKKKRVLFHCDAVQALPHLPCQVDELGADLLSLSAHKMYGPKGVGALYVRRRQPRVRLEPVILGGGHERGLRSGTLNVPGVVGFGRACEIVASEREGAAKRLAVLRNRLLEKLRDELPEMIINGVAPEHMNEHRLPNNLNVTFPGVNAEHLLKALGGVAVASGSACSTAVADSSYVLRCLDKPEPKEFGGVRIGLGRFNTSEEVDRAAEEITTTVKRLRAAPPSTSTRCD